MIFYPAELLLRSPFCDATKILLGRGINLFENGEVDIPDDWIINTSHSWNASCSPESIKLTAGNTNALNVKSKDIISLYSNCTFDANRNYLIAVQANSGSRGCLMLSAYTYIKKVHFSEVINLREFELSNMKRKYTITFSLKNCENFRLVLFFSGNVIIDNVKVVSVE